MNEGINVSRLHESENVILRLAIPSAPTVISRALTKLGFKPHDDFCFMPRGDTAEPWQTDQLAAVTFFKGDTELHCYFDNDAEPEPRCDRLMFTYLLASLPASFIVQFLGLVRSAQSLLDGVLEHRGTPTDIEALAGFLRHTSQTLTTNLPRNPAASSLHALFMSLIHEPAPANPALQLSTRSRGGWSSWSASTRLRVAAEF